MTVLGIETATNICGVAVVRAPHVVSEESIEEENVHAEKVLTLLDSALSRSDLSLEEIDAIAVSIGPGSFTGLRIGLSTAKGLASGLAKTLVAVPTLRALAQRLVDAGRVENSGLVLSLLDARRDEVYCQCFRTEAGRLVPLWEERDLSVHDLVTQLDDLDVVVTGDGARKLFAYLEGKQTRARVRFVDEGIAKCSASSVALVGAELLREGRTSDPRSLEPLYIKDFYFKTRHAKGTSG